MLVDVKESFMQSALEEISLGCQSLHLVRIAWVLVGKLRTAAARPSAFAALLQDA